MGSPRGACSLLPLLDELIGEWICVCLPASTPRFRICDMLDAMKPLVDKVLTARGPIEAEALGKVPMHEHLCSDLYDWEAGRLITEEKPIARRREYLLREAVPRLKRLHDFGCHGYCDVTMPPWRPWPDVYRDVADAADVHIVVATGFYREIELGTYFVKSREDQIWPYVRSASVEELAEMCVREVVEGIHGTPVRAGCIKLGTSQPAMTEAEIKTFRAGARAQKQTGAPITTHCTWLGAETSQLTVLDEEGVDLSRVVIGHTARHLMTPPFRKSVLSWMKRGANFMPTNLGVREGDAEKWRPLVEGIHEVFDAGHGDKVFLGLDSGYCSESGPLEPMRFLPPEPFTHMFTHTLPALRELGLTEAQEQAIMVANPQRLLPVR